MRSEAKHHFVFSYVARLRQLWLPCESERENAGMVPAQKLFQRRNSESSESAAQPCAVVFTIVFTSV